MTNGRGTAAPDSAPLAAAPLPPRREAELHALIARAATRGERLIAGIRIALVLPALGRSIWIWHHIGAPLLSPSPLGSLAVGAVLLGFSSYVLAHYRGDRQASIRLFATSVSVDAVSCFIALLTNPLAPVPGYAGVTRMPDPAAFLILTMASGLRLSVPVAILGGSLSLVALFTLVAVNSALGYADPEVAGHMAGYALLVMAATLGAPVMARRTRTLTVEAAAHTLRAERAERSMTSLLRDQHDVRTLLSAASLNADLLRRGIGCAAGRRAC